MAKPFYGQLAVTASAQPLAAIAVTVAAFSIKAPSTNAAAVFLGDSAVTSSTGYPLLPGDVIEYERNFQNGQNPYPLGPGDMYVVGTNGDVCAWFGTPGAM